VENLTVSRLRLDLDENALVAGLARLFEPAAKQLGALGIGDDAAVLPGRPVRVVTLDLLAEGEHFRWDLLTPRDLAIRALEANLSDIAAMGARPEAAFLAVAWPVDRNSRRALAELLSGLAQHARRRRVAVLGGDTVRAANGHALLGICLTGIPHAGGPVPRSGGRPGDVLAVTGSLGGAGLGLDLLAHRTPLRGAPAARAVRRFRRPTAQLGAAPVLARHARALIDLSDGLGRDAPRLARASGCGFEISAAAIPIDPAVRSLVGEPGRQLRYALSGGEDFELLAAMSPKKFTFVRNELKKSGVAFTAIGTLCHPAHIYLLVDEAGGRQPWPEQGWDLFEPPPRRLDARPKTRVGKSTPRTLHTR
jgi:thiamine-monophosphate kinase